MLVDEILGAISGVAGGKETCARVVAANVIKRLSDDYRREPDPDMPRPRLSGTTVEDLRVELELAASAQPYLVEQFRDFRNEVHDIEARDAGRLRVLLGVAMDLSTMAEIDKNPDAALKMGAVLADWLAREWGMRNFRLDDDFREVCITQTRRYGLLPRSWRYV